MGKHKDPNICKNRKAVKDKNNKLDPIALAAANKAQPSCSNYKERKNWMDTYIAEGGAWECTCPKNKKPKETIAKCPLACKLVSLTVTQHATQTNVTGAKNWAAVKKATDDVIVEAKTTPDTAASWNQIQWSGDTGTAVSGKPNQRKLSRAESKKLHIEAELGGIKDSLDVWILWADVTILTSGTTPAHAVQFGARYDGTENLGARLYDGDTKAVAKVVPFAKITPAGAHDVVKSGWAFKRERMSRDWQDGVKYEPPAFGSDYWNNTWVDDTSHSSFQKLIPDNDDKIYDRDAPSIGRASITDTYETYNNFREWIEWNGETCSTRKEWYWKARRKKSNAPQIMLKQVGTGNIALPANPHFP